MRTHLATQLSDKNVGESIELAGWVNNHRDHGGIIFIDLRDKSGLIQLVCDPADNKEVHEKANSIRDEFVLLIKGTVRLRGEGLENPRMETGKIEIVIDELTIENTSKPMPFTLGDDNVGEEVRLKHSYL